MQQTVAVIGGGAAGFFSAISCAEANPEVRVVLFEKSRHLLSKVRVSGGGRCNVTHACFDPAELVTRFPRGSRELLGPFHVWQPNDTIAWFQSRGVPLKTEADEWDNLDEPTRDRLGWALISPLPRRDSLLFQTWVRYCNPEPGGNRANAKLLRQVGR